jgi:hypothetical protein
MTDDQTTPATPTEPEPAETPVGEGAPEPVAEAAETAAAAASASEAWGDVLASMVTLGDAISAWARAAANEPDAKRHLDELRSGVNEMARQADAAVSSVTGGDFGKQVSEGASQAGDAIGAAAAELSQAAAPHVATAFAGLADVFGRAAQKVSEAASSSTSAQPHTRPAPEPPAGEAIAMPPSDAEPAKSDNDADPA